MGRTFLDIDMARAADLLGMDRRQAEMFRDLGRGHFVALGPAVSRRPLPIVIGAVETSPRSTSPKLTKLPNTPEDARDLILEACSERGAPDSPASYAAASADSRPSRTAFQPETPAGDGSPDVAACRRRGGTRDAYRRRDAWHSRRSGCRFPFRCSALPGFPRALPYQPGTRRASGAPSVPPQARRCACLRGPTDGSGRRLAAGARPVGRPNRRHPGRFPDRGASCRYRQAMPFGCNVGARLWQPFAKPRTAAADLFRGAGTADRNHGFPRRPHRRSFPDLGCEDIRFLH